jgi:TP901 family phage tail tape measure protein
MASGDFLARIRLALEGKEKVISGLQEVQGAAQQLTKTKVTTIFDKEGAATGKKIEETFTKIKPAAEGAAGKMGDFEKALRRVIIVAPVWMAFRTIIMGFFQGIAAGVKYFEDFDRAIIKAQAVIQGVTGDMGTVVDDLKMRIKDLSIGTGESMTKIAQAFYSFGETGLAFEESWKGTVAAVKYAMATLDDTEQVAKTMAITMKLLGHTIDETVPPSERQTVTMAKMYKLWQLNAYESNEFTESLRNFLPTANTMGLTLDQTAALLATVNAAALRGSRGGTLLRTSFAKLLDNVDDLASSLGIRVNPELDTTFDIFMKVLGAIKQLGTAGVPLAAQKAISTIFGGIRGGEPVRALIALYDDLQRNLGITTTAYGKLGDTLDTYSKRIQEVEDSASRQIQIFRELRTQLFEGFIEGLAGEEDFAKGMKKINLLMEELGKGATTFGTLLQATFLDMDAPLLARITGINAFIKLAQQGAQETKDLIAQIDKAQAGEMTVAEIFDLIGKMKAMALVDKDKTFWGIYIKQLEEAAEGMIKDEQLFERVSKVINDYNEKFIVQKNKQVEQDDNLLRLLGLKRKEALSELETVRMQNEGYSESDIELSKLKEHVSTLVESYNSLDTVIAGTVPKLSQQTVLTALLNDNWKKIIDTAQGNIFTEEEMIKLIGERNKLEAITLQTQLKQQEAIRNQFIAYEKADAFERDRIKRLMELMTMSSTELAERFKYDVYDKALIEEYWSSFSRSAQDAINDVIAWMYPELARIKVGGGKMEPYGVGVGEPLGAPVPVAAPNVALAANFGNIIIQLPEDAITGVVAKAGEELMNKLESDEDFKKFLAGAIRPYV